MRVELAIYNLSPRHSQGVREIGTEMIWGWSLPECFASSDVLLRPPPIQVDDSAI